MDDLGSITLQQFYMGRDVTHAAELTDAIRANAAVTVSRVNQLLAAAASAGVHASRDATTHTAVGSGWRPAGVNAATANAAAKSTHMTGQACDIRDDAGSRDLCRWALLHPDVLDDIGLWCERPQWTPSWLHVQTIPPRSDNRFYVPSSAPPAVAALPGEA